MIVRIVEKISNIRKASKQIMDEKKAGEVLKKMLEKFALSTEEKEAVKKAVGLLGVAASGDERMRSMVRAKKIKKAKSVDW